MPVGVIDSADPTEYVCLECRQGGYRHTANCSIGKNIDYRGAVTTGPGKIIPVEHDPVDHPSHYTSGKIEVIDFIEDQKLDYHLGNGVKYIARAGKKDKAKEIEDLEKAVWYIKRKITKLKKDREF